jgi:hypothetical protein
MSLGIELKQARTTTWRLDFYPRTSKPLVPDKPRTVLLQAPEEVALLTARRSAAVLDQCNCACK